jgi:anti-sigma B factor antagonist
MNSTSFEPDFDVKLSPRGPEGPVITVSGELDSGTCDEVLEAFRSLEAVGGSVTLDLTGVTFVDSAGTRTVIMIEREARDRGVELVVSAPANEVTELLRTAGVIGRFQLHPGVRRMAVDALSPVERVELELPLDARSPARARAEVRELLEGRDQAQAGDVVLLTSEIVTNAVIHPSAGPADVVGLRIFTYEEGIRVEVEDSGQGFDPSLPSQPRPDRGRGLFLVDRFASRWGTEHVDDERGHRFIVWFELDWRQARNLEPVAE